MIIEHIKPEGSSPTYEVAVCESSRIHPLRFTQIQYSGPRNSMRHTARNFDNLAGTVYSTTGSQAQANESCLLTTSSFLSGLNVLPISTPSTQTLPAALIDRIESVKQRKVAKNWVLTEANEGVKVSLVVFEPLGDQALASLVLTAADTLIFRDYPAKIRPYSTWRVDDGGEIIPRQFKILLLRQRNQRWEIATEFFGAEGSSLEFSIAQEGQFEPVRRSYRYTSPI